MAANTTTPFQTYAQNGKKLSFANWISNISPEETPFVSMTGKESIDQVLFQWQVDHLAKADPKNAQTEGFTAAAVALQPTATITNITQLLAKVVAVSDTANATANYGRGRELMYQLEKAGAEIKRDLEAVFLQNGPKTDTAGKRTTGGVKALIGRTGAAGSETVNETGHTGVAPDSDFGAVVVKTVAAPSAGAAGAIDDSNFESDLFGITGQLYLAGAKANVIMVHPSMAGKFSALQEKGAAATGAVRVRMFENRKDIDLEVNRITDPLGQTFKVVYNRHMPANALFIFNPADWTQMVLRAPQRTELAKNGDSTQYMITMECGLRHRNPYASAWLEYTPK